MSKLRQFRPNLLLMLILPAVLLLTSNSAAEENSGWEKWRPSGKSANFKIRQRPKSKIHPGAKTSLLIVATSDLHGSLSSTRLLPRKQSRGLLHLVIPLKNLRKKHPELILLDAGDTIQGDPSSFYFSHVAPETTRPLPVIEMMNWLRYDALTLGNHDFEPPTNILKQNIAQAQFSWLAANVSFRNVKQPLFPPYKILERYGVRVGILGLITPGVPLWIDPEQRKGLIFKEMLETAKIWVKVLREQEKVDYLIGLFHSGDNTLYDLDVASTRELPHPNAAGMIADFFPEFDLIISGHAHRISPKRRTEKLKGHQTSLISPGTGAQGLSTILVNFEENSGNWQISNTVYDYIKAEKVPEPKLLRKLDSRLREVEKYLEEPTSVILKRFPKKTEFQDCGIGLSYLAVKRMEAETFSLLPRWWYRDKLPFADLGQALRREHFFRWLPYDNRPVLVRMYGRQIEIMLESYRRKKLGWYARSSTILVPGGFVAELDNSSKGNPLYLKNPQGKALYPQKKYRVWLTNFHWNGGGGIAAKALLHPSQLLKKEPLHLRELIFQYLRQSSVKLPEKCESFLAQQAAATLK
jgi:2',3'-cyclic-nucleotide 2'-phosphodiesterase/3'-nucleotidase